MKIINPNRLLLHGIALFLIAIVGMIYIRYTWKSAETDKFDQALQIARSVVAALPKEDIKALGANPGDIDKPQYQVIKNALKAIIQINTKAKFAYIYTEQNNKIFFIADSGPDDSNDYSPSWQEYTEAKPVDKQPFRDGKELINDSRSDKWGKLVSVLIPLKDNVTGKTIAVFGIDFNAKSWSKAVTIEGVESVVLIGLLLLAFLFLLRIKANNKYLKIDIREHKRVEEVLRNSEEKYRYLFANNPQPMWIFDLETLAFLEVNQAAVNHYDYSRDEFLSMTIKDIHLAEDIPTILNDIDKIRYNNNPTGEWKHIKKNGEIIVVEIATHSVTFNGRNAKNVLVHDITDHKRSADELKFRNVILATQQEASADGILVVDENANIISYNQRFIELWGIPPELVENKDDEPVLEFVTSKISHPLSFNQRVQYLYEHKQETSREEIALMNGSIFERYTAPMVGLDLRYYGRIWYFHDITDSKRAEIVLQANKRQLTDIIDFLPDATLSIDKEKHIIIWNKAIEEMSGIPASEMIGKGDYAYTIPFFGEAVPQLMDLIFQDDIGIAARYHNITRNGETIIAEVFCNALYNNKGAWLLAKVSPLHDQFGNTIGAIESLRDITSNKQAEQELIKAKELADENNKLKTAFLNNISHEIRTPFNSILGFLSIIQENDLTTSEKDEYLEIINNSADRLMNTISDIVEISQIQAGQMILSVSETNIRRLTNGVYTHFIANAESRGLKFYYNNDLPISLEYIYTDSAKLNTILTILIGNALKFTKTGSIKFDILKNGEYLEFSVKDTGIGISENKQQAIFDRFMQADVSNTRQFEGSGLGLSIAKAYVELLDGKIWVESHPEGESGEKGAEFHFTILYKDKQEGKKMIENAVLVDTAKNQINHDISELKILIAEDDEGSALLIQMAVKSYGKEISVVRTGSEAVEACRKNPDIDLVLMDIKMPDMDGYEATEQIRQFNKHVVIIAQTAYALTGDREKTLKAGCNDYISKPIKKDKLLELMQKYFKK